jgi:hypothetical protein
MIGEPQSKRGLGSRLKKIFRREKKPHISDAPELTATGESIRLGMW